MGNEPGEINPNVEVVSTDTAKQAGTGGVSFDDLEAIIDRSKGDGEKPKAPPKAQPKEKVKSKESESEDVEDEDSKSEKPKDEKPKDGEISKLADGQEARGKKVKATLNGNQIELHTGAMVPVKIDGELQPVSVQTLINNYSGKSAWDKRFSELDNERQDFISRVSQLDGFMQSIFDRAEEIENAENPVAASFEVLKLVGRLAGRDHKKLMQAMNTALSRDYESVAHLSDIERENWELKRRLEFDTLDRELDTKIQNGMSEKSESMQKERETLTKYGISADEKLELTKYLKANNLKCELRDIVELSRVKMISQTVQGFNSDLLQDRVLLDTLIDAALKDPDITSQDVKTILRSAFDEKISQDTEESEDSRLSRKLGKTGQATNAKPKPKEKQTKRVSRADDFWDDV